MGTVTGGLVISSMATGVPIATVGVSGIVGGTYVKTSERPIFCAVAGTQIAEIGNFMVNSPTLIGTIGIGAAGTLSGDSVAFDGVDNVFTAVPSGTVFATNIYSGTTVVKTVIVGATVNTLLSASGYLYIGTSAGAVVLGGGTITGTATYNVAGMFYDSTDNKVYCCTGGSLVPWFVVGSNTTGGTVNVGTSVVGGVTLGAATADGSGMVLFAGTHNAIMYSGGTVYATITPSGYTITDITFDTAYSQALLTVTNISVPISVRVWQYQVVDTGSVSVTLTGTITVALVHDLGARTVDSVVSRQNLYRLNFADGTSLYNAIVSNVQIGQTGVTVTFNSAQTSLGAFAGPPDTTQLQVWNVLQTSAN